MTTDGATGTASADGLFRKLTSGFSRSTKRLVRGIASIVADRRLDDDLLDDIEDQLLATDLGLDIAAQIRATLKSRRYNSSVTERDVLAIVAMHIRQALLGVDKPLELNKGCSPCILLFAGVNGTGKTTTIGKLTHLYRRQGKKVLIVAADTFRAAAVEQLARWSERAGCDFFSSTHGADPASVVFAAIERAKVESHDIVLIDTAGRLQNNLSLMDELTKIIRVAKKQIDDAPHHTLLVLDGTTGQNAISQTKSFLDSAKISGLIITKMDGTARGGVLLQLTMRYQLPIHYVGVGEGVDDLIRFDPTAYALAITGISKEELENARK